MPEMTKEEAKKDLEGLVKGPKADFEKSKKEALPEDEQKAQEAAEAKAKEEKETAEAKAKEDAALLEKKDEEITDPEEKKRKTELAEQKVKDDEKKLEEEEDKLPADEKIKRVQEKTQKRIDKISNELKQVKDQSSKEAGDLRRDLAAEKARSKALEDKIAKGPEAEDDIATSVDKEEGSRIAKYQDEDKDKPREERREMSKADLNEWYDEDPVAVQEWMTDRKFRRNKERRQIHAGFKVKEIQTKQGESVGRVWTKHPELDTIKREAELKAEGKSAEEIHTTLMGENEKYKLFHEELVKLQPRHGYSENLPELVMDSMEKRIKDGPDLKGKDKEDPENQDKLDKLIKQNEELTARVQELEQDEGFHSNRHKKPPEGEQTEAQKQYVKTAKELNTPQATIDKRLKEMQAAGK